MGFLANLIFPGGFTPQGNCYLWAPSLIGLHVVSDSLIALSCLPIPITLMHRSRETAYALGLYLLLVNQPPPRKPMPYLTENSA
jgi:hypothetical protein